MKKIEELKKPNVLIVGVQKAGTTFLCAKLADHQQVFFSNPKELLFFQKNNLTQKDFYHYINENFSEANNERYIAEGSTVYLQWPNALANIQNYLDKNLKIIVCLRHPTDRALSFHLHNYKKGRFKGHEDILKTGKNINLSPTLSSMYSEHIERWLDVYGENMTFILFDDLLKSPTKFVKQATDFLGLKPLQNISEQAVNKGYSLIWKNDKLTLNLPEQNRPLPTFEKSQLEQLHELFLKDIEKTEKLIGQSLCHWKNMPEFTAKQKSW